MSIAIDRIDHLVLTVRDLDAALHFYELVLDGEGGADDEWAGIIDP